MERSGAARRPAVEVELFEFPAECIPVDSKQASGTRLISLGPVHRGLDKALFEFLNGFFEQNTTIDHLRRQGLNLILQSRFLPMNSFRIARGQFSSVPVSRR